VSYRKETFRVVSVLDPAIDTERMTQAQMKEYFETRDEAKIAPFIKPGAKPTWFHIREIPRRLCSGFVGTPDAHFVRNERAFMAAVTRIQNLHQEDGSVMAEFEPSRQHDVIPEEVLEERGISEAEIQEVGAVAWTHSFLARRMRRSYPVPLICLEVLAARDFLPAESSPSSQATSSGEASSASQAALSETANTTAPSADSSASPTAATATATPSEVAA